MSVFLRSGQRMLSRVAAAACPRALVGGSRTTAHQCSSSLMTPCNNMMMTRTASRSLTSMVVPIKSPLLWQPHKLQCLAASRPGMVATTTTTRSFASKKHKAVIRQSKGFRGRSKNCFKIAIRRLHKSWQHAYKGRKIKKRAWRKLWILKVNAAVRQYHWSYSRFINAVSKTNIVLNRKSLANLAHYEPFSMKAVVDTVVALQNQQKMVAAQQVMKSSM